MRPRLGAALIAVALSLGGCQPRQDDLAPPPIPRGSSTHDITVDGQERTFRLYLPVSLAAGRPVALVVMLHGGFGTGEQAEESYGWNAEADRHGFVVAYPDGLNRAWAVGGGCCGRSGREAVDDAAFIERMVATVSERVPIDPARVYATGMSNGAMLAYRLACDTAVFAAIGPVGGVQQGECAAPAPTSIIHIHGAADRNVPLDGSRGEGFAKIDGPPLAEVIDGWRAASGCGEPVVTTAAPVTTSRSSCADGRAVELILVAGAGHQWPGSAARPAMEKLLGADPPSDALDATAAIWRFFAAHPRQG